jgi:hypothetical protein
MANQGKHYKNPLLEWLEEEDGTVPTSARSAHLVDAYIKRSKPVVRKSRTPAVQSPPPALDPLQLREPAPPPKVEVKHSPAASPEHFRKLERLPRLRAPYQYKTR